MRHINQIIWHCAATKEGVDVSMETIRAWHKRQGWRDIGYHYVIELDGAVKEGRPLKLQGSHAKGHNRNSIGICYVGGVDKNMKPKDTRTPEQKAALYKLTEELLGQFPGATVHGHNEFAAKACPSFDVQKDWPAYLDSKRERDTDPDELSPDITPGLKPEDMKDEEFDPGWPADLEGPEG